MLLYCLSWLFFPETNIFMSSVNRAQCQISIEFTILFMYIKNSKHEPNTDNCGIPYSIVQV